MADEQTPRSSDDPVDPTPEVPSDQRQASEELTGQQPSAEQQEQVASQVRRNRPVRRSSAAGAKSGTPSGDTDVASQRGTGATAAAQGPASQGSAQQDSAPQGSAPRTPAPRPVRRQPASAAQGQLPTESREQPRKSRRQAHGEVESPRRTTPARFVRQSADELRKVIWPTGTQLGNYFVVVLVFVLFIVAYVGLLDFAFGWGLLKLLAK